MAWTPRTTAPTYGTAPYDWSAYTRGQCTWYAYWRVQEGGYTPPCWQTGQGSSGSGAYNNASTWLSHYRTPWQTKSTSYTPVPGDIAVFNTADGFGHVCVIESVSGSYAMITDYNISFDESFSYRSWRIGGGIGSTGVLLGYLHYPSSPGPTPSETPAVSVSPSSYTVTMTSDQTYIDFNFTITVTGIPSSEDARDGISFSSNCYRYTYTSNWTYTNYTVSGTTYRRGVRSLIVRYDRLHDYAYSDVAHMYYIKTFSNGSVSSDTRMNITIQAKSSLDDEMIEIINSVKRKKRRRFFSRIY